MPEKIRIFSVAPSELRTPRGTPLRVLKLLKEIARRDNIELVLFSKDSINPIEAASHVPVVNDTKSIIASVLKVYRCNPADVIICHTLGTGLILSILKLRTKSKLVLEMHGFIADEAKLQGKIGPLRYIVNSFFYKFIFWSSDLVTTCSDTATEIISKYNKNVVTVFSGADTDLFSPQVASHYQFKDNEEQFVIGYAGNARVWQGLDFLLDSFEELVRLHPGRFKLALLLSGNFDSERVKEDNVILINRVDYKDVPYFLASCDCLVIPRKDSYVNRVSFPSKLIEYMSMGKPVIASKTSDMDRIISHGETGLLFAPGDMEDFIKQVESLSDQNLYDKLSTQSRSLVLKNYTWDIQIANLLDSLHKLIKR